ncbi:MAG: VWA domain-containing protein, partial [Ghiorsea sp.]
ELLAYLQVGTAEKPASSSLWKLVSAALIGLLSIIAIAGPAWQQLPQPMYREQSALVILLDLSRSMDASDVKPSRLTRAKQKISDLLALRQEGQTALVVFAGSAFVVTPLTEDNQTILAQLQGLSTDIMPLQGGNIDIAIDKGMALLAQASVQHGQLLFITDSDAFSSAKVEKLTQAGHDLSIIAVGTRAGAPISKASGGFLSDQHGNIIIPQLNSTRLQSLAKLGHGLYRPLSLDDSDIQPILARTISANWDEQQEKSIQISDQWREEGVWVSLLLIPLVLIGFRRGVLLITLCFLYQPNPAQAFAWQDLWQTQHQQAQSLLQQEEYAKAAQTFQDPAWKAAAAYKNKDYEAALNTLNTIEQPSADDSYNKGNALAQLGRLDEAIAAYDQALQHEANHADAKSNKALLEKLKEKQQKEQDGEKKGEDEQQQDGKKSDKSQKSSQEGSDPSREQQEKQPSQNNNDSQQQKKPNQAEEQAKQQDKPTDDDAAKDEPPQTAEQQADKKNQPDKKQQLSAEDIEKSEVQQAFEQSLRRIPDDPAGLLRRKFKYQYQQQDNGQASPNQEQW